MIRRLLPLLLALAMLPLPVLAEPLPLLEDYAEEIVFPYDESDPSAGTFRYSYRYPHVDENAEGGADINVFYTELITYLTGFTIPMIQDAFEGMDSSETVTYTVTCNNDEYFSVLVRTEKDNPDQHLTLWEGHVFSRREGAPGLTFTLPKVLGLLSSGESEEWLLNRQTEKADRLIREMVWERITENPEGRDYGDLTEETLAYIFFPEENFYLDENGDPVFYLQPSDVLYNAPENTGLYIFPIPLEDILDEL